jgi:hypothetical protein
LKTTPSAEALPKAEAKGENAAGTDVLEVIWSSEGVGDLIPYEEKWKLKNHSTYLLGVGGYLAFFWSEVEINKPFNIFVRRGWVDLTPFEDKWNLINH